MVSKNIEEHIFHSLNEAANFATIAEDRYQCVVKIFKKRKNKKVCYIVKVYKNKRVNFDELYKLDFDDDEIDTTYDDMMDFIYTMGATGVEELDEFTLEQKEYMQEFLKKKYGLDKEKNNNIITSVEDECVTGAVPDTRLINGPG